MNSFSEAWSAAGRDEDDFDPPDGAFDVRLIDAAAFTAKTSGKDFVKLEWQLLEGEHTGSRFDDLNGLAHEVGMRIAREKLVMLGLPAEDVQTIEDLHRAVKKLIGTEATIGIKHGGNEGQYVNVNVLMARTGETDIPADMPEEAAPAPGGFAAQAGLEDDEAPY